MDYRPSHFAGCPSTEKWGHQNLCPIFKFLPAPLLRRQLGITLRVDISLNRSALQFHAHMKHFAPYDYGCSLADQGSLFVEVCRALLVKLGTLLKSEQKLSAVRLTLSQFCMIGEDLFPQ